MNLREVCSIPVERLCPDPEQPRKLFSEESLLGLAKTMAAGQLQPILAFERDGRLVILDGERRWRAAKLGGLASVDVLVEDAPTAEKALENSLVANMQREDLTPIEKAKAISKLMEATGVPASEVAIRIGVSSATVSRLLSLLSLPEAVQERIGLGELAASSAYHIPKDGTDAEKERLATEIVEKGLSRDTVAGKQRGKKRPSTRSKRQTTRLAADLGGGRIITLAGPELSSLDIMIGWLEELLSKARKARPRGMEPTTFLALLRDEAKASKSSDGGKQ